MKIAYTFVIADLLHFGHLQLLIAAKQSCDKFICGVLTDEAVMSFKGRPISNYQERKKVVESIKYVDEVIPQHSQDPTENLKEIQSKYPEAEILFVYGDNWKTVPGSNYIKSANVKTIQQHFYERLSNEKIAYKIIRTTLPDNAVETFTSQFAIKEFDVFRKNRPLHVVTTKAKTLQTLKPLLKKSYIEKTYVITVKEWLTYKNEILYGIHEKFSGNTIIVRSSNLNEDSQMTSKAGYYTSELNVNPDDFDNVSRAINNIIHSYEDSSIENNLDQILIQRQTTDIYMSGVIFTHDLETSSPYYVINYDLSGKTNIVTAGAGGSLVKIFRSTEGFKLVQPWRDIIEAVREIEEIIPEFDLDI
jgi:glutamine kinase